MTEAAVRFDNVSRHFGDVKAVDHANLEIRDGEFFSMLGPSGSGKTTCLRMIAGFDRPTSGNIFIWAGRLRFAALRAKRQHGVSRLCFVSSHDGGRQYRLWIDDQGRFQN